MLADLKIACRNQQNGCQAELTADDIEEHENN